MQSRVWAADPRGACDSALMLQISNTVASLPHCASPSPVVHWRYGANPPPTHGATEMTNHPATKAYRHATRAAEWAAQAQATAGTDEARKAADKATEAARKAREAATTPRAAEHADRAEAAAALARWAALT